MNLENEVQKMSESLKESPFNVRNSRLKEPLLLVATAMRGNYGPLIETALAQYEEEFAKYGGETAEGGERLDEYGFMNCFGTVLLAYEITGELGDEVKTLRPIAEEVMKRNSTSPAVVSYLSEVYK